MTGEYIALATTLILKIMMGKKAELGLAFDLNISIRIFHALRDEVEDKITFCRLLTARIFFFFHQYLALFSCPNRRTSNVTLRQVRTYANDISRLENERDSFRSFMTLK